MELPATEGNMIEGGQIFSFIEKLLITWTL